MIQVRKRGDKTRKIHIRQIAKWLS